MTFVIIHSVHRVLSVLHEDLARFTNVITFECIRYFKHHCSIGSKLKEKEKMPSTVERCSWARPGRLVMLNSGSRVRTHHWKSGFHASLPRQFP